MRAVGRAVRTALERTGTETRVDPTTPGPRPRKSHLSERRASRPTLIDPSQLYSIVESCAALDISRAQYYVLVEREVIRPKTGIDGRPRVTGAEIIRLTTGG
jgi:hypothetical protein